MFDNLVTVAVFWTIAVMTPGPNFFVTTQTAAAHGRVAGLACVAGVAFGALIWAALGLAGLNTLLATVPALAVALKIGGGAYIVWLGVRSLAAAWRGGPAPMAAAAASPPRLRAAFGRGLATTLSNPKALAFVIGLFALAAPDEAGAVFGVAMAATMASICFCWYGAAALIVGGPRMRGVYARGRRWIDGVAGLAFIGFGLKVALDR